MLTLAIVVQPYLINPSILSISVHWLGSPAILNPVSVISCPIYHPVRFATLSGLHFYELGILPDSYRVDIGRETQQTGLF